MSVAQNHRIARGFLQRSSGQSFASRAPIAPARVIIGVKPQTMPMLESLWDERNRARVLGISGILVLLIAIVDWRTEPYLSLGFLYLFPIMLAAGFISRWAVALLGIGCAVLSEIFGLPDRSFTRLAFQMLALAACGLFVGELVRNRRISQQAQARLRVLVETSPAAIVTVDESGLIELANGAAVELMAPPDGHLAGSPIAAFLPDLHHALRCDEGPQFRASMQCVAHRANGESFLADVWFSTYKERHAPKLAAIIADAGEQAAELDATAASQNHPERPELSRRELEVLRLLVQGCANKEIAARMDISGSAVKNTLQQLFAKGSVRSRAQLVRVALERYRDLL